MEIDLHITNKCNLQCKHCVYDSGILTMPDMSLSTVKELNKKKKKMNVKEVHITGGEPLLNSEIFDIINFLHNEGYIVRMQSNGFLINDSIAKKLKNSGIDHILISIDGPEDIHNKFRNNEKSFQYAINAVRICLKNKIFTRINTVISKLNITHLEEFMKKMSNFNVDQHSFFYLTPIGRGKNLKNYILSLTEWEKIKSYITFHAKKLNYFHKIKIQNVFSDKEDYNGCRKDNCLIMSNGNVYHCVFFVGTKYYLGNIFKNNICEIWDSLNFLINKININLNKNKCLNIIGCNGCCPGMLNCFNNSVLSHNLICNASHKLIPGCIRTYAKEEV